MEPEMPKQNTSFTVLPMSSPKTSSETSKKRVFYFAQLTLRILVIAFTLAGAITMTTSQQFKVVADSVVCGLSVLSIVLVIALNSPKSNYKNYFYLLLLDLVSVLLLVSGCSAGMAIGYVGKFGQSQTGWIAICDKVAKFCDKIMASIASSFVAVICLFVLTLMSAHNLKSHPYLDGI
ncbi:hypothetical protein BUALT_Bualt04G0177800 [Buddleja alternifolia]|uniref:CASP-like protein n=1 Tax=Buddleja alternifolia TaxID=168488 RepID=A0AAV6XPR9_9LAMI|nr:hypothetical protein BUALT_Bualt04G0177800 [Buddleja alternifolia]